jgi:hypothetical protein
LFSDWPTIFPNAGSAIALVDRLVHHADIITIDGDRSVANTKALFGRVERGCDGGSCRQSPPQATADL